MAAGTRRVSAASARAHTRKGKSEGGSPFDGGILKKLFLVSLVGFLAWAYKSIQPPPPNICGSPNGPPVTAPRVQLSDGRHLAYKEHGVPKEGAKFKIILMHGFMGSRNDSLNVSKELQEELGVYIVTFDRAGYGESDPDPKRSVKSAALDIEQLADQLDLGPKFYVMGTSIGGFSIWGCLKYIPHRLAGAALLAPVVNYRWNGFPANLFNEAYYQLARQDQWALTIPYYTPWLTYWWMTQKWFPSSSVISGAWKPLNRHDAEMRQKLAASGRSAELVAGLLGVESGQDAVIRGLLYERLNETVKPYPYTVAEFTDKLSTLRNTLGHTGDVDEGLVVPKEEGAEGKVSGNILAGDMYSLAFSRTPAEILRIVYASGNESMPGGFFPRGGGGKIALSFLK